MHRGNWHNIVRVGPRRASLLSPEWLAEHGASVKMIDIRPPAAFTGPLGHVPGSAPVALDQLAPFHTATPEDVAVVVIDEAGEHAPAAAVYLEALGRPRVAVLDGGVLGWRARGYAVRHDPVPHAPHPTAHHDQGEALTTADIRRHVGAPGAVQWIKLAALVLHGRRSCVDGREPNAVLGTAGGDAGELLLALAALEAHLGVQLEREQIGPLLRRYVDTFGRFAMHTDLHAIAQLHAALVGLQPPGAPPLPPADDADAWERWLSEPPAAWRAPALTALRRPVHIGCGHLHRVATLPERYHVRPALTDAFLTAYWTLLWNGDREIEHRVLDGHHNERAVLIVRSADEPWPFAAVPLVRPAVGDAQTFVVHPQVATFLRRQVARFLVTHVAPGADPEALSDAICALGDAQLQATVSALADGLPRFEVVFGAQGQPEVRALD